MDFVERERLVNRICSGLLKFRGKAFGSAPLFICAVSPKDKYLSDEIYFNTLKKSLRSGVYSDDDLYQFLLENGIWSEKEEEKVKKMNEDMESLKIIVFQSEFDSERRSAAKMAIRDTKLALADLTQKKHSYDYMSATGVAAIAKSRYLALMSLRTFKGKKLFSDNWKDHITSADTILNFISKHKISEAEFRELVRNEPWRSLYSCGKPFRKSILNWTEDQRSIIFWSKLYTSINRHPKRPSEDVMNDDDSLDGWLILQRRDSEPKKMSIDDMVPEKIRNGQEIFIMGKMDNVTGTVRKLSKEEAMRINEMNSPQAKQIKKQRSDAIKKHGELAHVDLPDVNLRLRQEIAQMPRR